MPGDVGIARIAVLRDPLLDPPAARIVARKGQDIGAAVVLWKGGDFGGDLRVVDGSAIRRFQSYDTPSGLAVSRPAPGVTSISLRHGRNSTIFPWPIHFCHDFSQLCRRARRGARDCQCFWHAN
jgi:hypothetical protein